MKTEYYYFIVIFIIIVIVGVAIETKFPKQMETFLNFIKEIELDTKKFFKFLVEIFVYIIDLLHLLALLIGTIFLGLATLTLFYKSDEVSRKGLIDASPVHFINAEDLFFLWDSRIFAIGAGILFFFTLSLLIISFKITYFTSKYEQIEKL